MASRTVERGFTLIEMMLAIGILTLGVTSLIGIMTVGVTTRVSTERTERAVLMADQVLQQVIEKTFDAGSKDPALDSKPATLRMDHLDGYPGMRATVEFVEDTEQPGLVLASIRIGWLEQGQSVTRTFQRILVRQATFAHRIAIKRRHP